MAKLPHDPARTHFLNVDLDIYSRYTLRPLLDALAGKVFVHYAGRERSQNAAHLEVVKVKNTADATIREFCSLIAALPATARQSWKRASRRDFNIGVQAGSHPPSSEFVVAAKTMQMAAGLGVRVVLTVYAPSTAHCGR